MADGSAHQGRHCFPDDGPANETSLDRSCIIDPARTYGPVTVLRSDKHLIFGLCSAASLPMSWMNYSGDTRAAPGFEFSTQPFDISHRETVDTHEMFDAHLQMAAREGQAPHKLLAVL
jgi:hypothetical protein